MVLNWILYFVFVHGCLPLTICSELLVLSGSCLLEHGQTGHTLHMQLMQSHTRLEIKPISGDATLMHLVCFKGETLNKPKASDQFCERIIRVSGCVLWQPR